MTTKSACPEIATFLFGAGLAPREAPGFAYQGCAGTFEPPTPLLNFHFSGSLSALRNGLAFPSAVFLETYTILEHQPGPCSLVQNRPLREGY